MRFRISPYAALAAALGPVGAAAQSASREAVAIDAYVRPYVATNNFTGQILVARGGKVVFAKAYGDADRDHHIANTLATPMHVASMSTQFTVAAIMRLVDQGALALDTRVSSIVPSVRDGDAITIRNLLEQRSGLSDINARADYGDILTRHQTPATLVALISNDTLSFAPGAKYVREEHSASNVLALIVEKKTGLPFAEALRRLVFAPLGMSHSGADDDSVPQSEHLAHGYTPDGVLSLVPTPSIHWSAKAGNGSVYLTARDEMKWVHALFDGEFLSPTSRAAVVDSSGPTYGYGWFRHASARFGEFAYTMSGRAPGFSSYVVHLPRYDVTVIALSNVYSSLTADIANDVTAIVLGKPFTPFVPAPPLTTSELRALRGLAFTFPADFYQPNATLGFSVKGRELFLRWPSDDLSPMIPLGRDRFVDRAYGVPVVIERDARGRAMASTYDRFRGVPAK